MGNNEKLIFLHLLMNADDEGWSDFCDRKVSRETDIPYQQVRTIHKHWIEEGVVNAPTNAKSTHVNICECVFYEQLQRKINALANAFKKRPKARPLEEKQEDLLKRKERFTDELKPYVEQYGKDMCNDFWRYWTEPNKSGTKMKFELQQTWDIERRLITWEKNNATKYKRS